MKTLIIMAHPNWQQSSTQTFLKEGLTNMTSITWYDLTDKMTSLDVKEASRLMRDAERIIIQFPMYWYSAPHALQAWFEEVLTPSLYEKNLKGKEFGIVVSTGVAKEHFVAGGKEEFTLSEIFRPYQAIANKCQMTYLPPFNISMFDYMSEAEKKVLLINYQQYLSLEYPSSFQKKEEWLIKRVEELTKKGLIKGTSEVEHITQVLISNRDELDDLLDIIKEMDENE